MAIIKTKSTSLLTESKDYFSSLNDAVNFFIPNATKIKPSYVPFGNIGIYTFNNRIFKFSFVHREAQASMRIMGASNFKNVVEIFSIHKFYLNNSEVNYIIEMEKLSKIKKVYFDNLDIVELYKAFNFNSRKLLNFIVDFLCCYEEMRKAKILKFKTNKSIGLCCNKKFGLEDVISIYKTFKSIDKTLFLIEELLKGHMELKSLGIIHNDLHSDNLMADNKGNYKIIDFGMITLQRKF
jgi:serine/threonine protein kinase